MSLQLELPIDIINKILSYTQDMIIAQYNNLTNDETYIINWKSDLLWDIKSIIIMKRMYPLASGSLASGSLTTQSNRELYIFGKAHYKKLLKQGII